MSRPSHPGPRHLSLSDRCPFECGREDIREHIIREMLHELIAVRHVLLTMLRNDYARSAFSDAGRSKHKKSPRVFEDFTLRGLKDRIHDLRNLASLPYVRHTLSLRLKG